MPYINFSIEMAFPALRAKLQTKKISMPNSPSADASCGGNTITIQTGGGRIKIYFFNASRRRCREKTANGYTPHMSRGKTQQS